jgi:hydroxypyruvate isomerase
LFVPDGIMPLIEPMNEADIPGVAPASLSMSADLIRNFFKGRLGLQYDCYHAARRGEGILEGFAAYADIIRHIQVSDCPGRNEPGTGALDYPSFFRHVRASGYPHFIGAEYRPLKFTNESLAWMKAEI